MYKKIVFIASFLVVQWMAHSQPGVLVGDSLPSENTINGKKITLSDTQTEITFLVAGHVYGAPSKSIYPSPSLTNNLHLFSKDKIDFVILLGDNYRFLRREDVSTFRKLFLDRMEVPVYNAIGNHDINGGEGVFLEDAYLQEFNTVAYHSFFLQRNLLVVLNTELFRNDKKSNGSIEGKQLAYLKKMIGKVSDYDNLLIFVHKEIDLFPGSNYDAEVRPLLHKLTSLGKHVYIFSGDMKLRSSDLYFKKDGEDDNITFLHTHLEDSKEDKVLEVTLSEGGLPRISALSLEGIAVKSIEQYTYVENKKETVRKRTFLQRVTSVLVNKYFLLGLFLASFGMLTFRYLFRYFTKK